MSIFFGFQRQFLCFYFLLFGQSLFLFSFLLDMIFLNFSWNFFLTFSSYSLIILLCSLNGLLLLPFLLHFHLSNNSFLILFPSLFQLLLLIILFFHLVYFFLSFFVFSFQSIHFFFFLLDGGLSFPQFLINEGIPLFPGFALFVCLPLLLIFQQNFFIFGYLLVFLNLLISFSFLRFKLGSSFLLVVFVVHTSNLHTISSGWRSSCQALFFIVIVLSWVRSIPLETVPWHSTSRFVTSVLRSTHPDSTVVTCSLWIYIWPIQSASASIHELGCVFSPFLLESIRLHIECTLGWSCNLWLYTTSLSLHKCSICQGSLLVFQLFLLSLLNSSSLRLQLIARFLMENMLSM